MSWRDTLDLILGRRTSPKNVPTAIAGLAMADARRVGKPDARLFRAWSEHSEWVRAAINIRKNQVSGAVWDIVPFDINAPYSKDLAEEIKSLFNSPNPSNDSFRSFIEPIVEDVLALDAGSIEKVRSLREQVRELWPVDGGKIRVNSLWDGSEAEPRYFWYPDGFPRADFKNEDFVYIMANPRTYSVVGLSPLETLKMAVDAELAGSTYNDRQVRQAAPDGAFDLGEGARPEQVDAFKDYWAAEIAGKNAMAILGGTKNPKFIPFRQSNRDAQFMEWQTYLVRKICAVFGISPQDLGLTFDLNRATADVQQENTEDRGIRPLMSLVQDYLTREIVWDRGFGGFQNNLSFRFTRLNIRDTLQQAKIQQIQLANMPSRSVDEIRMEQGLEPWGPPFDMPMVITPTGAVVLDDVPSAREATSKPPEPAPKENPAEKALAVALLNHKPPEVKIEKGAVEVQVKAGDVTVNNPAIEPLVVEAPPPIIIEPPAPPPIVPEPKTRKKEVSFIKDDIGVVSEKVEVEYRGERIIERRTKYIRDSNGLIIGKTETEEEN